MRPARYGYGGGKSYINMNRDYEDELGGWVQAPNPERFCNKTVSVMKFVNESGNLICAIANYGMHATLGFLQPDIDGKMKVCGNVPGAASEYVEARFGHGAVAIWTSAAAGDQNPLTMSMVQSVGYTPEGQIVEKRYTFDLGDRKLEVIWMPGHTLGSITLLDPKERSVPPLNIHFRALSVMPRTTFSERSTE